jgi:hypothetical protein
MVMEARTYNTARERVILKRILRQHNIKFEKTETTEELRKVETLIQYGGINFPFSFG